jgi:hypothetical protein
MSGTAQFPWQAALARAESNRRAAEDMLDEMWPDAPGAAGVKAIVFALLALEARLEVVDASLEAIG